LRVRSSPSLLLLSSAFPFSLTTPPATETYTLSLHDALPIFNFRALPRQLAKAVHIGGYLGLGQQRVDLDQAVRQLLQPAAHGILDRKSTRLNSSHVKISYAVFCLKKKKNNTEEQ